MKHMQGNGKVKLRIVAMIMALIMIGPLVAPAALEVMAASVENPWDGQTMTVPKTDENGTYLITTGAELAWFAAEVNNGNGEINGKLMNYIYLNDYNTAHNWIMIGNTEETPYKGTFDGNGQKVVYMRAEINMDDPEHKFAGLFGVVDGGTVRNLTVLGKVIQGYGNYDAEDGREQFCAGSGGIAGYLKEGQIINCINYARTTMEGEAMYRNSGGIVGINQGLIMHCENYGKLSTVVGFAQNHVGGIVGLNYGVNAQVLNSVNYATVQGYFYVGGIAGAVKSGSEINSCCNYGTVKGNAYLGGIAGRLSTTGAYSTGSGKECAIQNVYNLGNVTGYGTGSGIERGGIVGQMGYENWTQEATPPMPLISNAYSTADFGVERRVGAIVGYMLSGRYGTIYGRRGENSYLSPIGSINNRAVKIEGESLMLTDDQLKSAGMIEKLGSAFTMSVPAYDTLNNGYPKLTWQGLPSDILSKIDDAYLELNGWLGDTNRRRYGKNYAQIESLVETYKEKLGTIITQEDLDRIMTEAREKLGAVKPAAQEDAELAEAIDNGVIALQEYYKKILKNNEDLTDSEKTVLNNVLEEAVKKVEASLTEEEVRLAIRDGKDALDSQLEAFTADKKLEEVRTNALQIIKDYRASEKYDAVWMSKIKTRRDQALKDIEKAKTVDEVTKLMEKAKNDIDEIIDQVPEAGAWDGKTKTEPKKNANSVYQISNGNELAWFAEQVNKGSQDISAELTADFSLGGNLWTPIGTDVAFRGSFDGKGHVIRGLYIDVETDNVGLFGKVGGGSGQKIQNLTVSGNIEVGGRVSYVGGIVGNVEGTSDADRCQITNCQNNVVVTVKGIRTLDAGAGGIAGKASNAVITACANTASISIPTEEKGGISYYSGGLVGVIAGGVRLQTSYNSGTIYSGHTAGGLAGELGKKQTSEIYSCYNGGNVTGIYYSGGLIGSVVFNVNAIKWCYTSGAVNPEDSGLSTGALFGLFTGGDYDSLLALKRGDTLNRSLVGTSSEFVASGKFISESELKNDDTLNVLNKGGNCFIRDYLGFQNGYPILSWQMTLEDFKVGSITELQKSVSEDDYVAENWAEVQRVLAEGAEKIRAAGDMETVDALRTQIKEELRKIETKAGTEERKLQEAKDAAISVLENYVDLTVYRDQEQTEIRNLIANAKKYILMSESIAEVEQHRDEAREQIDRLPTAWQYYNQINMEAAAQVDAFIADIGEVIYNSYVKTSIQLARDAYDSLTETQKGLVTKYQILLDAEETWARLEEENRPTDEDLELAAEVDRLIAAIGEVTLDSGDAIAAARHAFNALTDKQKALVSQPGVLTAAEQTYNQLKADRVTAAIAAIGEVTPEKKDVIFAAQDLYDALTDEQKALVTAYPTLQKAVTTYQNLLAAQPVIDMIDALGSVDDITLDSRDQILAAIQAYNSLTGDQQQLVKNYGVLEAAASVYDALAAIQNTIDLINQIGIVSSASGPQIRAARNAYDSLTPAQQKQVPNASVLENAEAAFAALSNPTVDDGSNTSQIKGNPLTMDDIKGSGGNGNGDGSSIAADDNKNAGPEGIAADVDSQEESNELPAWLAAQLGTTESDDQNQSLTPTEVTAKRKKELLWLLGIVLCVCIYLTGAFGWSMKKASKKRKDKSVHY